MIDLSESFKVYVNSRQPSLGDVATTIVGLKILALRYGMIVRGYCDIKGIKYDSVPNKWPALFEVTVLSRYDRNT